VGDTGGSGLQPPGSGVGRHQRLRQDAVIAAAILMVLLVWRLTARPAGPLGKQVQTALFGPLGLQLARDAGLAQAPLLPEKSASLQPTQPPPSGTNLDLAAGTQKTGGDEQPTLPPVKYIKAQPSDAADPTPVEAVRLVDRLKEASAQSGDVQLSLFWNNYNDLDLHCIDPAGEHIWYRNRISTSTGGTLDVDQNARLPFHAAAVENIYWPVGGAPGGQYKVFVTYYAPHGGADPTQYTVRTVVQGKTNWFTHTISFTGSEVMNWICTIQYDPTTPDPAQRCRFLSQ
jgi:hypothetical protein